MNSVFRRADWFVGCTRGGVLGLGAADDCEGGEGVGDIRFTGLALDWWDKKRLTAADLAICWERGVTWNRIPRREMIWALVIASTWARDRVASNRGGRLVCGGDGQGDGEVRGGVGVALAAMLAKD